MEILKDEFRASPHLRYTQDQHLFEFKLAIHGTQPEINAPTAAPV
jgi:hypothetical protein